MENIVEGVELSFAADGGIVVRSFDPAKMRIVQERLEKEDLLASLCAVSASRYARPGGSVVQCLELDKDFAVGTSPSLLELQQLKSCGFNAVVDLRMPDEVGALTITDEREAARSSGMTFLHIAVPARTVPSELLNLFRQEASALPRRVFVHCTKGGRAALFTEIHLGLEVGATEDEIVSRIRGVEFFDEPDLYEDSIRKYIRLAREPYSRLEQVIW